MRKLSDPRQVRRMVLLCAAVYFASYVSRINFGALILEIVRTEGYSKPAVSMAVTASFMTYGAGQLVSGWLGDRASPRLLVFAGLLGTAAMNLLIPFCPGPGAMTAVWGANGFVQALLWPPLVRIMTELFEEEAYRRASVRVSWGSSFGTIAVYLTAPLCILWSGWRSVFFLAAAICAVAASVWLPYTGKVEGRQKQETSPLGGPELPRAAAAGGLPPGMPMVLGGIVAAIICQGALRDGVTTWMPSFIAETYRLDNTVSILSGVVLPVFSIVCFRLAAWLYDQKGRNELRLSGYIFCAAVLCAVSLRLTVSYQAVLSVVLSAALTGCMHGIDLLLICLIPPHFSAYGSVSFISGLLNACTYAGSALSAYATAFFSERLGWNAVLTVWAATALLGAAVCLFLSKRWSSLRAG